MTTAHASNKIDKGKTNPVTKEPIVKYQNMGAVDRSDQMLTHNAFKRRTIKWWKKIFFHMFMLGGLNAFLIHKATGARKLSHLFFRRDLAKQLVQFVPLRSKLMVGIGQSSLFHLTTRNFMRRIKAKEGGKQLNHQ